MLLARKERRWDNLPEILLWKALRARPAGLRFRRQHPVGPFVIDFACMAARLAIGVDGEAHERGERPERDARRDAYLRSTGWCVLRIPARDVLADIDAALRLIVGACAIPLHQPAAGPPPRTGEVLEEEL